MKKSFITVALMASILALAGCAGKTEEPESEIVAEVVENAETEEIETVVSEPQPEEEKEVEEDTSWAGQNKIEYSDPKELTMQWYCYIPLNGEKLEDVTNEDNKAVYSKPVVTVEENGDTKVYSVTYTVDASNTFVVPDSYDRTDPWKGTIHDYQILDPISGTVIPFSYDGNEYEVNVSIDDTPCSITASSSMDNEKKTDESVPGEERNYEVWFHKIEYIYTLSLKITVPVDKDDIVLWVNTTEGQTEEAGVPHIFGENYDEVREDCIFIKLADLVTE